MHPAPLPPKHRRAALTALSAAYDLDVGDRRVAAKHFDALVRSRSFDFAELLSRLSRDQLKTVCEALDLPADGREKQLLIDRILATGEAPAASAAASSTSAPAPKINGKPSRMTDKPGVIPDIDPTTKLSREQLERYLWAAADILRGSIDSSDYKNYIFGLLFLKRLSDRFNEECEALIKEGADPEDHDEHQFFVPKRARWSEIQKAATGLGELLNKASEALEESNTALEGVLAGIDYNDERKLRHRPVRPR